MRHNWQMLGGSYRARQHRCKTCGLRKHTLIPTEGFPVSTYQLKDGSEVKGKAPKCQMEKGYQHVH